MGNLTDRGYLRELMEKNGFYAELYNSQFEASKEEQAS